jgi:hypothetical protein
MIYAEGFSAISQMHASESIRFMNYEIHSYAYTDGGRKYFGASIFDGYKVLKRTLKQSTREEAIKCTCEWIEFYIIREIMES